MDHQKQNVLGLGQFEDGQAKWQILRDIEPSREVAQRLLLDCSVRHGPHVDFWFRLVDLENQLGAHAADVRIDRAQ